MFSAFLLIWKIRDINFCVFEVHHINHRHWNSCQEEPKLYISFIQMILNNLDSPLHPLDFWKFYTPRPVGNLESMHVATQFRFFLTISEISEIAKGTHLLIYYLHMTTTKQSGYKHVYIQCITGCFCGPLNFYFVKFCLSYRQQFHHSSNLDEVKCNIL